MPCEPQAAYRLAAVVIYVGVAAAADVALADEAAVGVLVVELIDFALAAGHARNLEDDGKHFP